MRRVIGWSWIVVWLGCLTISASQLPPDVLVDKFLLQATMLNEEKNHKGALEVMDRIVALQGKHNLTLPEDFPYRYAQTALAVGSVQAAIDSASQYLSATGRGGKHYRKALELLVKAERKLQDLAPDPVAPTLEKPDLEPRSQSVPPSLPQTQKTAQAQPAVDCSKWNTKTFFRKATVEDVTACISAGTDLDARSGAWSDCSKCTALHRAALFNENAGVIQVLIDAGAQVSARDAGMGDCINCTPLHFAAMRNENPEEVRVLLEKRADPNVRDDGWERTALHWAFRNSTNPVIIRMLLVAGAELNARDEWKHTPLHLAALRNENPAVVETLLAAGADQMAENKKGKTPLQVARKRNRNVLRSAWTRLPESQKAAHQARARRKKASAGPSFLDVAVGVAGGAAIATAGGGTEEAVEAGTVFAESVIGGTQPATSAAAASVPSTGQSGTAAGSGPCQVPGYLNPPGGGGLHIWAFPGARRASTCRCAPMPCRRQERNAQ